MEIVWIIISISLINWRKSHSHHHPVNFSRNKKCAEKFSLFLQSNPIHYSCPESELRLLIVSFHIRASAGQSIQFKVEPQRPMWCTRREIHYFSTSSLSVDLEPIWDISQILINSRRQSDMWEKVATGNSTIFVRHFNLFQKKSQHPR